MRAPNLIHDYLEAVKRKTGASTVSLAMYMEPPSRQSVMVLSDGQPGGVPELATEASAWDFIVAQAVHDQEKPEPLRLVSSRAPGSVLIRLAFDGILARPEARRREVNERRSRPEITTAPAVDGAIWFGLTGCSDVDGFLAVLQPETTARDAASASFFATLSTRLAWSVYQLTGSLQDPISQLPGRMEFRVFLNRAVAAAREHAQWVSLLLVNPDDFSMINHRYGREQGDIAVREIADQLSSGLRQTDAVFHYGGAVFGVVLPATDGDQCRAAAEKVRRHLIQRKYVDSAEHLTFSIGGVSAGPLEFATEKLEPADLLKSVDVALNRAKLSGGSRVIVTNISDVDSETDNLDAFSGIFSADTEKDYRNMLLLWEAVGLVSANPEPGAMAHALVDRLALGFRPDRIALFQLEADTSPVLMATNVRDESQPDGRASGSAMEMDKPCSDLLLQALESGQVESAQLPIQNDDNGVNAYAVPLSAREKVIGCLYLDGRGRRLELDASDILFLKALATQMAIALDRAELAANWIREKDRERLQLRDELQELRQSLPQKEMIYESSEMHSLMDTLERVAPTDATILIIGESGTGKEMLAHSIHEFSVRKDKPFVVFDCGAVTHTLLEAELFGHVKGAFTGAESASVGRILQADGGTLFLDEIGELPMLVQAKLLRFVQEKEFSAVGSTQNQKVDVRIVAATNRELQDEVAAGRFRADLYYRLQVIALQAVPLRYRQDDILPLARHFLAKFSRQYRRCDASFSDQALKKLLSYEWPGNVRELQNTVLRSVLTSDGDEIDACDVDLLPEPKNRDPGADVGLLPAASGPEPKQATRREATTSVEEETTDPWNDLRAELVRQIDAALEHNADRPVPLGRWLTEDLVLAASEAADQVARRAAHLLSVPESTYRRHYQKVSADLGAGLTNRTPRWEAVRQRITRLVETGLPMGEGKHPDVIEQARLLLLAEVDKRVNGKASVGAALMGVSSPTFKRWTQTRMSA